VFECSLTIIHLHRYASHHSHIIAIIIREFRFKNKGEPLIGEKKEDAVEYKEPMQEYVDDFKLKKTEPETNKGTEMKEV